MTSEDKQNELAWQAKRDVLLKQEYNAFLRERGLRSGPEAAQSFVMAQHGHGLNRDIAERDFILLLAGELPPYY